MHQEPGGASSRSTDSTGAVVISGLYGAGAEPGELDPVGANSGTFNPYYDPNIPPDDGSGSSSQSSTGFGSPWHMHAAYSVDGIRVEPEIFMQVAAMSMQSPFNMLFYFAQRSRLVTGTRYYDEQWTRTRTVTDGPNVSITSQTAHEYWSEPIFANESWSLISLISVTQVGAPQQGVKKPLNKNDQKTYDQQRAKLLSAGIPEKCAQFLEEHGIDPSQVMEAIRLQQAFSGTASTISRGEAGTIDVNDFNWINSTAVSKMKTQNQTIRDRFDGTGVRASTIADRSTVYYSGGGLKALFIFHEAIHSVTGRGDRRLALQLGLGEIGDPSKNITSALEAHDCKW